MKFELADTKRNLGRGNADATKELERALRALAAEKTANDLLQQNADNNRAEIEALAGQMKTLRSSGNSNSSELEKLRLQLKAFQTDNDHLHESLNEYIEVIDCL